MRLDADMLARIGAVGAPSGVAAIDFASVVADSRLAGPASAFVAVRGVGADGHAFAAAAVAAGAPLVVAERPLEVAVPVVVVRDSRRALAVLAMAAAGDPTRGRTLVGVTGTDGKTSTAMMIEAGLAACGHSTGLLGTVTYRWPGVAREAALTTPDAVALAGMFADMAAAGVTAAVMEVSSHALDQRRADGCAFGVACFTNLTRDHLDYHGTPEAYADAKLRFFTEVLPANPGAKGAVVNGADPFAVRIKAACPLPVVTFSTAGDADVRALDARFDLSGIRARVATPWGEVGFESPLIGPHNLANALTAIGAAGLLGLPLARFAGGVAGLARIPGRLERVVGKRRDVTVFVDYSHTPKSIENVLTVLRPLVGGAAITIVCGAGGDRDRGKRPLMGRAAALLADRVIVTSDNPRSEDPDAIIDAIVAGVEAAHAGGERTAPCHVEPDRRRAILEAIRGSRPGDVVVVAGKGHEDYQIVGTQKLHFSDVEVAKEILDR
jgi:UDP-N-acetylmuramoyl-L-alanyl-D-glutamate--2,6-diaminopimelate ligase